MAAATYHGWPASFHEFSRSGPQHGLAADHVGTIGKHHDADKWKAVVVPCKGGNIIFGELLRRDDLFSLVIDGNVDVSYVEVENRDQVNASNFRDLREDLR